MQNPVQFFGVLEEALCGDYVERLRPTDWKLGRNFFRAAHNQLISLVLQQLNFAEWPIYCDHSVTSADVRLASGLSREGSTTLIARLKGLGFTRGNQMKLYGEKFEMAGEPLV